MNLIPAPLTIQYDSNTGYGNYSKRTEDKDVIADISRVTCRFCIVASNDFSIFSAIK
jgi:hypothetical protein